MDLKCVKRDDNVLLLHYMPGLHSLAGFGQILQPTDGYMFVSVANINETDIPIQARRQAEWVCFCVKYK